jgi:hypothetical protein
MLVMSVLLFSVQQVYSQDSASDPEGVSQGAEAGSDGTVPGAEAAPDPTSDSAGETRAVRPAQESPAEDTLVFGEGADDEGDTNAVRRMGSVAHVAGITDGDRRDLRRHQPSPSACTGGKRG